MRMNDSAIEANVQSLCDGGLLMQVPCSFFYDLLKHLMHAFKVMSLSVLIVEL